MKPLSGKAKNWLGVVIPLIVLAFVTTASAASSYTFSTGNPDALMATGSRPAGTGKIGIESADDFIVPTTTQITGATFTGLLTAGAAISDVDQVIVEIYRVFPLDSVDPPSGNVPTRTNGPSDVSFDSRDSAGGTLTFTLAQLNPSFTAGNSVLNGINPIPGQTTGGEGAVTGSEVEFSVIFTTPFLLPADHYFFVPQVGLNSSIGGGAEFMWLSAPKPIVSPGTPFSPDFQSWIQNANLDPDWLRIGTDIVGAGQFNAAFSLNGQAVVPEPSTLLLLGSSLAGLICWRRISGIRSRK